jgi:hypothetical protein
MSVFWVRYMGLDHRARVLSCGNPSGIMHHESRRNFIISLLRIPAEADQHSWMKPITIPV